MKFDSKLCLVSDQNVPPASLGDSMAETSRYWHLYLIDDTILYPCLYTICNRFITDVSYVRHPDLSEYVDWPVSSDQCIPFALLTKYYSETPFYYEMCNRFKRTGLRTPDGNLLQPALFAILYAEWLLNVCVLFQALIFKLPWRWDDSQKKFVSSGGSSADYLNWFHCAVYCRPWVRNLVKKETLFAKIQSYYLNEPNNGWVLELYNLVIQKVYKET